ncbi:protein KBP homolog, partial [Harpegnathos saltator]|uniref:protein KBP homolog n=1 Tax=Harpegnathos saltator TaxID=610380 RepID=UPI000DBEE386
RNNILTLTCLASIATAESVVNTGNSEDSPINVREEFAKIFKSCYHIRIAAKTNKRNKQHGKVIKDILSRMNILYNGIIERITKDAKTDEIATLAQAYLYLFDIRIAETDNKETTFAEDAITKCIELLKGREPDQKFILTALSAYSSLGILYHKQNNEELSLSAFNEAFQFYLAYTDEGETYPAPFYIAPHFGLKRLDPIDLLEKRGALVMDALLKGHASLGTHVATNRVYTDKIARCQHKLLSKRFDSLSPTADCATWTLMVESLSEYFITHNRFTEARDHLAAASFMMKKFYENQYVTTDGRKNPTEKRSIDQQYQQASADIAKYWTKYGIQLLRSSQERILHGTAKELCEVCNSTSLFPAKSKEESNKLLIFDNVRENLKEFTATITDSYLLSYTDASILFETVMKYLDEEKAYYTFEKSPMTYLSIILNISRVHKLFACYVSGTNKLESYKQRLQILLTTLKKIHPNGDFNIWPVVIETVICTNDVFDVMYESSRLQFDPSKESGQSTDEPADKSNSEMLTILSEVLKSIIILRSNLYASK